MKIEARFEELNARFNSERAERLQNMHRMNKEQVALLLSSMDNPYDACSM